MENENIEITENDIQNLQSAVEVSSVSQEDFYNFNNNFVIFSSFVSISLGVVAGLLFGKLFDGIFND